MVQNIVAKTKTAQVRSCPSNRGIDLFDIRVRILPPQGAQGFWPPSVLGCDTPAEESDPDTPAVLDLLKKVRHSFASLRFHRLARLCCLVRLRSFAGLGNGVGVFLSFALLVC